MKMPKKLACFNFTFFPTFQKKKKTKLKGFCHFVVLPKWIINNNDIVSYYINNGPISHFFVDYLDLAFHLARIAIGLALSIDKNISITQQMTVKVLNWTCWSSDRFNPIFFYNVTSVGCSSLNRFLPSFSRLCPKSLYSEKIQVIARLFHVVSHPKITPEIDDSWTTHLSRKLYAF